MQNIDYDKLLKDFLSSQQTQQEKHHLTDNKINDILCELPDKQYYEYAYHKAFMNDESMSFNNWKDWKEWSYPIDDLVRFKHIVLDNRKYITNKTVIDFACHLGYVSLFCLHLGAKFVTATNIREKYLNIAQEMLIASEYPANTFNLLVEDIHDYETNTKLCNNVDTIFLCGLIYHVYDHYEILKSLASAKNPTTIIIDTLETKNTLNSKIPMIEWAIEDDDSTSAYYADQHDNYLVGHPTRYYLDMVLNSFGYVKINESDYVMGVNKNRSTHVYEKNRRNIL